MAILKGEQGTYQQLNGAIGPDGNPIWGEGFVCKRIKEGTYVVEFKQPFSQNPAPVCTVFGHEWKTFNLSVAILDVGPQYFICITSSPDRPVDCGFTFIVFGDA